MAGARRAWQRRAVKTAFALLLLVAGVAAALLVPIEGRTLWARAVERGIPAAAARATAHALRATWDALASLSHDRKPTPEPPQHSPRHPSRKAQASAPAHKSREGIVPQPPKEKLGSDDRAALDQLVSRSH
jgi:hypothetical protein